MTAPARRALAQQEVALFYRRLADRTPNPETELRSVNDFTLLVAVVLSAQATDASVNLATRDLFERVSTPEQMVALAGAAGATRSDDRLFTPGRNESLSARP